MFGAATIRPTTLLTRSDVRQGAAALDMEPRQGGETVEGVDEIAERQRQEGHDEAEVDEEDDALGRCVAEGQEQ